MAELVRTYHDLPLGGSPSIDARSSLVDEPDLGTDETRRVARRARTN